MFRVRFCSCPWSLLSKVSSLLWVLGTCKTASTLMGIQRYFARWRIISRGCRIVLKLEAPSFEQRFPRNFVLFSKCRYSLLKDRGRVVRRPRRSWGDNNFDIARKRWCIDRWETIIRVKDPPLGRGVNLLCSAKIYCRSKDARRWNRSLLFFRERPGD